jgi:hypothetical protein
MHRLLASIVNFDSSFTLMKTLRNTLATFSIISIALTGNAQTINCDWFTVTGLEPDTFDLNNTLINIEMGGGTADFANYPYIPSITDCNGDTVATGSMFFFGQIGGTVQGYPVSAISDDVCLPLTIEFIYGNDLFLTDTCLLTFGGNNLCELFTVTGMESDTLNPANTLINIEMAGDPFDQINYPLVTAVTDCNGDTIATGELVFFGQLGQTTLGYPVSIIGSDVCYPLSVHFFYGTDDVFPQGETCILNLDDSNLSLEEKSRSQLSAYPNPTSSEIRISATSEIKNEMYFMYNSVGHLLSKGYLASNDWIINMVDFPKGMYMLRVGNEVMRVVKE